MVIYLSGPITGDKNFAKQFARWHYLLEQQGHTVVNPACLPVGLDPKAYMPVCLSMLEQAEAIAMLPGWESSRGATLEKLYAEYQGKRILYANGDELT